MGLFSPDKCERCGSKEHVTSDCPHGFLASKCDRCGSKEHPTADCPHGFLAEECSRCGSRDHASEDCPHGFLASECSRCGSREHASADCPHGWLTDKCAQCGSRDHATEQCPHTSRGQRARQAARSSSRSDSEESGSDALFNCLAWAIGIAIAIAVIVWLIMNVVLPVAFMNSALLLTLAAIFVKRARPALAAGALAGGLYLLADVFGGWFADDFVRNVVKDRVWIAAFVVINAVAMGVSAWLLVRSAWDRAHEQHRSADEATRQRGFRTLIACGAAIALAVALLPALYFSLPNSLDALQQGATSEAPADAPASAPPTAAAPPSQSRVAASGEAPPSGAGTGASGPAGPPVPPSRGDTWTDPATGLVWAEADNGTVLPHGQAVSYCEALTLGGKSDWRLPGIDELESIYRPGMRDLPKITAPLKLGDCCLWSADLVKGEDGEINARYFDYWHRAGDRGLWNVEWTDLNARALCVRGEGKKAGSAPEPSRPQVAPAAASPKQAAPKPASVSPEVTTPSVAPQPARADQESAESEADAAGPAAPPEPSPAADRRPAAGARRDQRRSGDVTRDATTGLLWTKRDNGRPLVWEEAVAYCEGLDLAGFTDWRLPTLDEFAGIHVPPDQRLDTVTYLMTLGTTRIDLELSTCCLWTPDLDRKGRNQYFARGGQGGRQRIRIEKRDLPHLRAVCVRDSG